MKTLISIFIGLFTLASFGISKINQQWFQEYYYESGNLKKVVNYKGEQYQGTSTLYYDSPEQTIKMEVHYNEGKKVGFGLLEMRKVKSLNWLIILSNQKLHLNLR